METQPCAAAYEFLAKNEVEPVTECLPRGSASWYIPIQRIKSLFNGESAGTKLESIFLCPCNGCNRDGGSVDDRSTNFSSLREKELRNDYAAIYALLIYINRPGLIRVFQKHELKLHGTTYLREEDFRVLSKERLVDLDTIKKRVLRYQYSFLVRTLKPYSDITAIPPKELLPIKESPDPKGEGSFAEVRCFEFQDEEYRSQDFGQISRFARKIFKGGMSKSAFKEWYNLQSLSKAKATIHRHLMPALGAYLHGDIFFILQEEADLSLSDYLQGQGDKFDSMELWNQVRGLADGLDELHRLYKETKIAYHQDLKPANILVVKGILKIADFGLLEFKPVLPDDAGNTGVVSAHNTGYYAAPRHGRYTREDDIWSLACIVSELATSDIEGRNKVASYREARTDDGLSQDTPRFFSGQIVKAQVLDQHHKLQLMVQRWDTTDHVEETRGFQKRFYVTAFFTLLNSMFRHGHYSNSLLDAFGQITVPDAGQFSKAIEKLRKEAMPVFSPEERIKDASFPHIASGPAGDLVLSLEDTLEEFRGSLSREDERISRSATSTDFKQFLANMQVKQHSERCQRGLKRLGPIIEAFERFAQMLNDYCDPDMFMAFIWGPLLFILENASTHAEAFNEVLNMYRHVGLNQPTPSQYEELFCSQPATMIILSSIYYDVISIHKLALSFFRQRRWTDLFGTTWTRHKSRIFRYITNMTPRLDLVIRRGTASDFSMFQYSCAREEEQIRNETDNEDLNRRQVVDTWLKSVDVENQQYYFARIRAQYPDTGQWLLNHATFKEWFDPQFATLPTLLWLHGNPGAGKTILASLVIEEIGKLSPAPTVLFFYFKQDDSDRDNFISMARSFLTQILKQDRGILDYIYNRCCNSREAFLTSRVLVEELLLFALETCDSAYIVLDGLDECCSRGERKTIVEFFRNVIENLNPDPDRLRCLFVSRKDSARKDFEGLAQIAVGLETNEDDIDNFSRVQFQKLKAVFEVPDQRLQEIVNFVSAFAEGVFLVAELVWINLCGQTSIHGLEQELGSIPTELDRLDQAYERIMRTILNKPVRAEREEAIMLLGWLVRAKRPLKLHEVQTMKSINLERRTIEFEQRRFRVDPKDLCESLVEVRPNGSIELVHLTARIYLLHSRFLNISAEEIGLATLCVDYLNLPIFNRPFSKQAVLDGNYGFMEYAILNWVRHLEAGLSSSPQHNDLMQDFIESCEALLENHWNNPTIEPKIPKRTHDILAIFQGSPKHKQIQQAIASTQEQTKRFGNMRPDECALNLTEVVNGIRIQLESVVSDSTNTSNEEDLTMKYGTNLFKCPRFSCKYFTEGFASRFERDRHVERHERPARCTDRHCTGFIIGFATEGQLARHLKETHPSSMDQHHLFPTEEEVNESRMEYVPEPSIGPEEIHSSMEQDPDPDPTREGEAQEGNKEKQTQSSRSAKRTKTWQEYKCSHCSKKFTKRWNWESHLKIHGPSQALVCDICGATCARNNDLTRHMRKHTADKAFTCSGVLENGQAWGCGQSFVRPDILRNHHKSKKGQRCIAALREQEQEQAQLAGP